MFRSVGPEVRAPSFELRGNSLPVRPIGPALGGPVRHLHAVGMESEAMPDRADVAQGSSSLHAASAPFGPGTLKWRRSPFPGRQVVRSPGATAVLSASSRAR